MHTLCTLLRSRSQLTLRLPLLLLLMIATTMVGLARVEITNATGTPGKKKNPETGKDEVIVTIKYTISDVPDPDGVVLAMEATMTDDKGTTVTVVPIESEVSGAIGGLTGNGQKEIEWKAEQTLVRLGKQGKWRCFVTLTVEGKSGATRATLDIRSYKPSGWEYFEKTPAVITNLTRVSQFPQADCTPRGANWHGTVEAGAVFYTGEVTRIPRWRGRRTNDPITGTADESACSAFLAIKDQGTAKEKIWINFARHFAGVLNINGERRDVDWEFQFRYTATKTSKTLQAGNAGDGDDNSFTLWNEGLDFGVRLEAAPEEEENTGTFEIEVIRREFKYFYKGAHVLTFTALDDGYFEGGGTNTLILKDGPMQVNGWLTFSGEFALDTSVDAGAFASAGAWVTKSGTPLFGGPLFAKLTDKIGVTGSSVPPDLDPFWHIAGFTVITDSLQFEGGPEQASGVKFDLVLKIKELSSECGFSMEIKDDAITMEQKESTKGIRLKGVKIADNGWEIAGIEVTNIGVSLVPTLCIQKFLAVYDKAAKRFTTELSMKGPFFDEIGGGFVLVDGQLSSFKVAVGLGGFGTGGGIPIPYPPAPAHVAVWSKFEAEIKGIDKGPASMMGKATIKNRSDWEAAPAFARFKSLLKIESNPELFEADGSLTVVFGESVAIEGSARTFGWNGAWLMEQTGKTEIFANPGLVRLNGNYGVKFLNFGSGQYMLTGSGDISATVYPEFDLTASLIGDLYIPDLFSKIPFGDYLNHKFGLPMHLSQAKLFVHNLQATGELKVPDGTICGTIDMGTFFTDPYNSLRACHGQPLTIALRDKQPAGIAGAADTTWLTFAATADMQRAMAHIYGTPEPRPSVLVDPTGRYHTGTASDSSVIFFRHRASGMSDMWEMVRPRSGAWKLGVVGMTASDSTHTWAIYNPRPAFQVTSTQSGRQVTARWTGAGAPAGSIVNLYLDDDETGYNGIFIGAASESTGSFSYTLTDSLPECGYHLYAMRDDNGVVQGDYSDTYHENVKAGLGSPIDLAAQATAEGNAVITWKPAPGSKPLLYGVHIVDAAGNDSLYTTISFNYTMVRIHIDNWQGKRVYVQAIGENDIKGCPSAPIAITLAGVDDPVTGASGMQRLDIAVVPQPAVGTTTIHANLTKRAWLAFELYDVDGTRITTLKEGVFEPGTVRAELDASTLPNGIYFVRVIGTGISASRKIVVQR